MSFTPLTIDFRMLTTIIDQQIAFILQRRLLEAYQDFGKAFAKSCSQEEMAASIPVTVSL